MKKYVRQILDFSRHEAAAIGATVHVEHGGKHNLFIFEKGALRRVHPVANAHTNADHIVRHACGDMRRVLREMAG